MSSFKAFKGEFILEKKKTKNPQQQLWNTSKVIYWIHPSFNVTYSAVKNTYPFPDFLFLSYLSYIHVSKWVNTKDSFKIIISFPLRGGCQVFGKCAMYSFPSFINKIII